MIDYSQKSSSISKVLVFNHSILNFSGLKSCSECSNSLHLHMRVGESRFGLGSVLKVLCIHCSKINDVPTDSQHRRGSRGRGVFDVNTKVGFGESCLHRILPELPHF